MLENQSFGLKVKEFILKNLVFVGLIGLGIIMCMVGGVQYLASKSQVSDIVFTSDDQAVKGATVQNEKISFDVEGKVQKPGVYALPANARLQDALIAAGGLSSGADREYVSRNLNLAQKISDGGKVYIPSVGESSELTTTVASVGIETTSNTVEVTSNTGLININSASESELDTLPKVGPATAKKIINGRPYGTIEDLVSKKVLTQKTFDGLKDRIVAQ